MERLMFTAKFLGLCEWIASGFEAYVLIKPENKLVEV